MSKSDALKSPWITRLRVGKPSEEMDPNKRKKEEDPNKKKKEEGPSPGPVKIYFSKDFSSCWHSSTGPQPNPWVKDEVVNPNESKGCQGMTSQSQNIVPKEEEEEEEKDRGERRKHW